MAKALRVFLVHLRRPGRDDLRADPFYEFGSFGCTTCHYTNLLHQNHAEELKGARLAFVQGGKLGSRLVFLTPPIREVRKWRKLDRGKWIRFTEVKWKPGKMPFKYEQAPILVWNSHPTQFSLVKKFAMKAQRQNNRGAPMQQDSFPNGTARAGASTGGCRSLQAEPRGSCGSIAVSHRIHLRRGASQLAQPRAET